MDNVKLVSQRFNYSLRTWKEQLKVCTKPFSYKEMQWFVCAKICWTGSLDFQPGMNQNGGICINCDELAEKYAN